MLGVLGRPAGGGDSEARLAKKDDGRDDDVLRKVQHGSDGYRVSRYGGRTVMPEAGRAVGLDRAAVIRVEERVLGQGEPETGQGQ